MKKKEAAMVCFSGGQDSTTCLFWAKKHFSHVEAVCFTYGQKHALEVEVARKIAADAQVPFHLLDVSLISQLDPNCSLVNDQIEMDQVKPAETYPNTFVPGRNMVFLTFVAILARSKGIHHLVTGVSEADFSGYPDCRDTFIRSLNVTLNLAMDDQFVIHTPLMDRDKSEVWELSDELGVFDLIRTQTLTCYNGVMADGCGHCPACRLRKAGLEKYLESKNESLPEEYSGADSNSNAFWILEQKRLTGFGEVDYETMIRDAIPNKRLSKLYVNDSEFLATKEKTEVVIAGKLIFYRERDIKNGKMCSIQIDCNNTILNAILWPDAYEKIDEDIANLKGCIVALSGTVEKDRYRNEKNLYSNNKTKLYVISESK